MSARLALSLALLALAALYAGWFGPRGDWIGAAVFALPALLLAADAFRPASRAPFWAGVLALGWFSHGVMTAWTTPADRGYAWAEIALALLAIYLANLPGLRARFGKGRRAAASAPEDG